MRTAILLLAFLAACSSTQELESLRRENERLRQELVQAKSGQEPVEAEPTNTDSSAEWRTHVVKNRDTLSELAEHYYGDSSRWEEIYRANLELIGGRPDRLAVDMKLRIPPK